MLIETMTHAEVYRELDRDRETATVWWRHHLETLRRPVLKARQLPVIRARQLCIIVGSRQALAKAVGTEDASVRNTRLEERMRE